MCSCFFIFVFILVICRLLWRDLLFVVDLLWESFPHNIYIYIYIYQIKSNHFYCHITTAQVPSHISTSEILMSVLQTVQKNNRQFTYGQTVQKNNKQFTYGQTVQKKTTTNNLHMDRQCKKTALEHLQCSRQCKKKKQQQQFTYGQTVQKNSTGAFTVLQTVQKKKTTTAIYIWTDSAKKQHWSIYSAPDSAKKKKKKQQFTYGQTVQKNNSNLHMDSTYLQTVQKTMCKIHIHVLSTLSVL